MNRIAFVFLLFNLNYGTCLLGKSVEKSFAIYAIEELVDGNRFVYRSDLVDGKLTELWAVNGQKVTTQEYEEAILKAEREEIKKAREREIQKRKAEQEFKVAAQYSLVKKILDALLNEIEKMVVRIKNPLLNPYIYYSEHTIGSPTDFIQLEQDVQKAKLLLLGQTVDQIASCQDAFNQLESYPEKLNNLYQDSVNYAIKTCDNTRTLKDLLAFVS